MREGFNFYRSYYEVFNELNSKDKLLFIEALLAKQFYGVEPNLTGMAKFAYLSQKHSIDKQVTGYERAKNVVLSESSLPLGLPPTLPLGLPPKEVQVKVQVQGEVQVKVKEEIPPFEIFLNHALSKKSNLDHNAVKLKYDSWVENNWKDGNDKKITNWKSKLTNTVQYIKERTDIVGKPTNQPIILKAWGKK